VKFKRFKLAYSLNNKKTLLETWIVGCFIEKKIKPEQAAI
jgi:hypothetical protein